MKLQTLVQTILGCAILSTLMVADLAAQGRGGGGGNCRTGGSASPGLSPRQMSTFRSPSSSGLGVLSNSYGIGPNYAAQQAYAQAVAMQLAQQQMLAQQAQQAWLARQEAIAQAEAREKQLKQERRALAIQKRKEKEAAKDANKKVNAKAVIAPVAKDQLP